MNVRMRIHHTVSKSVYDHHNYSALGNGFFQRWSFDNSNTEIYSGIYIYRCKKKKIKKKYIYIYIYMTSSLPLGKKKIYIYIYIQLSFLIYVESL